MARRSLKGQIGEPPSFRILYWITGPCLGSSAFIGKDSARLSVGWACVTVAALVLVNRGDGRAWGIK
jgi:hypothetical protein